MLTRDFAITLGHLFANCQLRRVYTNADNYHERDKLNSKPPTASQDSLTWWYLIERT